MSFVQGSTHKHGLKIRASTLVAHEKGPNLKQ